MHGPAESPSSSSLVETRLFDLALPTVELAYQKIFDLGMENAPEEICGLLVDESRAWAGGSGFRVVQLNNRAEDRCRGYVIDPATLRDLAFAPKVWDHVTVWHTHPGGLVGPSAGDREHHLRGVRYIVVTIPTGEVVEF